MMTYLSYGAGVNSTALAVLWENSTKTLKSNKITYLETSEEF